MALKASEISQLIKERIENFEASAEARDVGTIIGVTDGIVRIHGLADARYGEMLEFPQNTFGMTHPRSPGWRSAAGSRRRFTRGADRRQGTDRDRSVFADRESRAGRD